jgi:chorismate mutase
MKHNHPQIHSALSALRSEIDSIDDCILDLLEQRYAVTQRVSVAKTMASSDALPIRPQREQAILERLATKAVNVPSDDIAHIWRSILTLSARSQKAYRVILWSPEGTRFALAALAASRFGSAVPIEWAESAKEAVEMAQAGDAILLMPADLLQPSRMAELELIGQYPLACIHHPWAAAMGKLDGEALILSPQTDVRSRSLEKWQPASWRGYVHHQLPAYSDAGALELVEARLSLAAPVVDADAIGVLTAELAEAQEGCRLVIQAGDCAEPIDATRDDTWAMGALVHKMADALERTGQPVTRLGRLAGQFGKPRSAAAEKADGATIAVYRGDAVNRPGASSSERAADPERLHEAYAQSRRARTWLDEAALAAEIQQGKLFTSHEALLLNYEAALTRRGDDGNWRALSAHSLWLGDRTRDPRGAHVEYLRGIAIRSESNVALRWSRTTLFHCWSGSTQAVLPVE